MDDAARGERKMNELFTPPGPLGTWNLKDKVNAFERQIIMDALRAAGGNKRRAARSLGVLPTTLHEKMKRLSIPGVVVG